MPRLVRPLAVAAVAATALLAAAVPAAAHDRPRTVTVAETLRDVGPTPHFTAVDPRLDRLFVTNVGAATLTVVDAGTGDRVATVSTGQVPHTVQVDRRRHLALVTNLGSGTVTVLDTRSLATLATVPVGRQPHGLAVDSVAGRAYVTNIADNSVSVLDLATLRVAATIALPYAGDEPWPWGVAVDPIRHRAYVTGTGERPTPTGLVRNGSDRLYEIDTRTARVLRSVVVGANPWNVAVDPRTGTAFVGVTSSDEVAAVRGRAVVARAAVGRVPHGLAVASDARLLFVNNTGSNTTSVLDTRTARVLQTVPVGAQPQGIAVDDRRGLVYVANQAAGTVSVLRYAGRSDG